MTRNYDIPEPRIRFFKEKNLLEKFDKFKKENTQDYDFTNQTNFILSNKLDKEYLEWLDSVYLRKEDER